MRERNEPILLFAESEHESYLRLKKLELLEPEVNKVRAHCSVAHSPIM